MASTEQRSHYVSDGKVVWSRLPMAAAVVLAAAVGVGWLFSFVFSHGFYYFILVPVVGGLVLAAVLRWAVRWTRCRNRWIAAELALVAALLTYAAYYEFCMQESLPPGAGWHVELLPRYVVFRLQTDVVFSSHDAGGKGTSHIVLNSLFFGLDLAILLGIAIGTALDRAGWAYCLELNDWMRREKATWPPGAGPDCLAALETGTLAAFVARTPAGGSQRICCRLTVEYAAPAEGATLAYPVYATLADVPQETAWNRPNWVSATLFRQVALKPAEVLALRPLLPQLAKLLAVQHPQLADVPAEVTPALEEATEGDGSNPRAGSLRPIAAAAARRRRCHAESPP